ncbi:flavin-containing monooxygenase FMO GS-OX5-like protein [Tanacetum coccineum]
MTTSLKVVVIGAGVAGLTAAQELLRESHQVNVFEKSHRVGGTWAYDPRVESGLLGLDPNRDIVQGSLYKFMRTNLPRQLMSFTDFKFGEKVYDDPRSDLNTSAQGSSSAHHLIEVEDVEKGMINARESQNNDGMVDPSHQKLKQTLWENKCRVLDSLRWSDMPISRGMGVAVSEGVHGSIPGMEPGLPRGKDHMDEDFVADRDDDGSPSDDSVGDDSDGSASGGEQETILKRVSKKEATTPKTSSSKKRNTDESLKKKKQKRKGSEGTQERNERFHVVVDPIGVSIWQMAAHPMRKLGVLRLKHQSMADDTRPIDSTCKCMGLSSLSRHSSPKVISVPTKTLSKEGYASIGDEILSWDNVVLAYEPVWATGKVASRSKLIEYAEEVSQLCTKVYSEFEVESETNGVSSVKVFDAVVV